MTIETPLTQILRDISTVTPAQFDELYSWFIERYPQLSDQHKQDDLTTGSLNESVDHSQTNPAANLSGY